MNTFTFPSAQSLEILKYLIDTASGSTRSHSTIPSPITLLSQHENIPLSDWREATRYAESLLTPLNLQLIRLRGRLEEVPETYGAVFSSTLRHRGTGQRFFAWTPNASKQMLADKIVDQVAEKGEKEVEVARLNMELHYRLKKAAEMGFFGTIFQPDDVMISEKM